MDTRVESNPDGHNGQRAISAKIRDALVNEEDLVAVYLLGAQADDKAYCLSDVDVAVLSDDQMSAEHLFQRTLAIGSLHLDHQRSEAIRRIREEGLGHGYQGYYNALTEARRLRATLARSATRAFGRVFGR